MDTSGKNEGIDGWFRRMIRMYTFCEEILHQFILFGNYETFYIMGLQWDKPPTSWCRISSIHNILTVQIKEEPKASKSHVKWE